MPFRLIIIIVAVFGLALLIFFTLSGNTAVEVTCDDFTTQGGNVTEEVEIDGWSDFLILSLCSNPTTGFNWELIEVTDPEVLVYVGDEYVAPEAEGVVGTAGKEVWTFNVLKAGSSNITMQYSRPWEGGEEAEWTFALNANVK